MPEAILRQRAVTTDPEHAVEALRSVLGGGDLQVDGALRFDLVSTVDDGVSVTRVAADAERIVLDTGPASELLVVAVREGRVHLERDGDRVDLGSADLGLVPTGRSARLIWSDAVFDVFVIGSAAFARLLGVEGRPVRLRAPRSTPRSRDLALLWDRLSRVLAGIVLEASDLYERDLVRDQMIDTLAATTIEAFELADDADADDDRDAEALRRAEAFMRARLGDPLTIPQIAHAAGVSLRGLQLLYRRHLDSTPLLHLRALRVSAAREVLRAQAPGTTVGAVARRFGYSNAGRFGAHYRAAYDEAPSATLQRTGTA